jgi:hypothetical protein
MRQEHGRGKEEREKRKERKNKTPPEPAQRPFVAAVPWENRLYLGD